MVTYSGMILLLATRNAFPLLRGVALEVGQGFVRQKKKQEKKYEKTFVAYFWIPWYTLRLYHILNNVVIGLQQKKKKKSNRKEEKEKVKIEASSDEVLGMCTVISNFALLSSIFYWSFSVNF